MVDPSRKRQANDARAGSVSDRDLCGELVVARDDIGCDHLGGCDAGEEPGGEGKPGRRVADVRSPIEPLLRLRAGRGPVDRLFVCATAVADVERELTARGTRTRVDRGVARTGRG